MSILINSTIFYNPGSQLVPGQDYQVVDIPGKPTYKYLGMFRWSRKNPSAPVPAPYVPNATSPILATIDPDTGDVTIKTSEGVSISAGGPTGSQVPSDWNATTGAARILNKPTIPTQYTDSMAKDAAASIFTSGSHSGITFSYDSSAKKVNCAVSGSVSGTTNLGVTASSSSVSLTSSSGTGATISGATSSTAGVMSAADKTKLDGLSSGSSTNLSNTPSASSVVLNSSSGTGTTLAAATTSNAGVMSAADKTKLDGLSGPSGSSAPIYRKLTVTANGQTGSVMLVGYGTTSDLNAATVSASAAGDILTVSSLPSTFKLASVSATTPSGFNTGTAFSLVFPDPFGVSNIDDSHLVTLMHYNGATPAIEQAQTNIGVSLASGVFTVIRTGLTAGTAAHWKACII